MRLYSKAFVACALVCAVAGSASASTSVLTFTVTNATASAWTSLLFEIRAPLSAPYDPVALAAVEFNSDASRHSTSQVGTFVELLQSGGLKQLRFSFSELGRVLPGQSSSFTMTIENPQDSAFRVVRIATAVPAPGAVTAAGLAGLVAVRRRRVA